VPHSERTLVHGSPYNASIKATIIPSTLTFTSRRRVLAGPRPCAAVQPQCDGQHRLNQPNDVRWRWLALYDQLAHLDASFDYEFTKHWTAKFFYAYESFANANWQTGPLTPAITGTTGSIFLGQHWQDYGRADRRHRAQVQVRVAHPLRDRRPTGAPLPRTSCRRRIFSTL